MPALLPIRPDVRAVWLVRYLADGEPPSDDWIVERVEAWIDRYAPAEIRETVRANLPRVDLGFATPAEVGPPRHLCFGGVEERSLLARHDAVAMVGAPIDEAIGALLAGVAITRALADALGGAIEDLQTCSIPPLDVCRDPLPANAIEAAVKLVRIDVSRWPDGCWMTTSGMVAWGLPELELVGVPEPLLPTATHLLRFLGVYLPQKARRTDEGVEIRDVSLPSRFVPGERVTIGVSLATSERSGVEHLRVHPVGRLGASPTPLLERLDAEFVDPMDEVVVAVPDDDPELARLQAEVAAELPTVRERFRRGLPSGAILLVRARFRHGDDASTSMWIRVDRWKGGRVRGRVAQSVELAGLQARQRVQLDEREVEDWAIEYATGRFEGHRTRAYLFELARKQRQVEISELPPDLPWLPRASA